MLEKNGHLRQGIVEEKIYKQNQHKTAESGRHKYQMLEINGHLRQGIVEEKIYKQNRPKTAEY